LERVARESFEPAVAHQILSAYRRLLENPTDADQAGNLGMILQAYGKYEPAAICYRYAVERAPQTFRWWYYLGNVQTWLGEYDSGSTSLRKALALNANYLPGHVRLADVLVSSGENDEALDLYRKVIASKPHSSAAHLGLGRLLATQGDLDGAIASLSRASELRSHFAAAEYALAMAYRKKGELERARTHLERFQQSQQRSQHSDDPLLEAVASMYAGALTRFAAGSALAQEGKVREAIAEFEAAVEKNPKLVVAHVNLIAMYGQLNQPGNAEKHYKAAVEADPGWVEAYYNWGLLLVNQSRKGEATAVFRKAVELNPHYADAHVQLGILLEEKGEQDQAQHHYLLALESIPGHRQARYLAGVQNLRAGNFKEAIALLEGALEPEDARTPLCMQALAFAYEGAGQRARAIHYLTEARRRASAAGLQQFVSQVERDISRIAAEASRK
jgi:tetratricopeptide (TPR) repeat protein